MSTGRLKMLAPSLAVFDRRTSIPAPKETLDFYSTPEWRELMRNIIRSRGRRCEDPKCRMPGRTGIRVFGDHIRELRDGGAPLDPMNILLRCGSCHTRKTIAERNRRAVAT